MIRHLAGKPGSTDSKLPSTRNPQRRRTSMPVRCLVIEVEPPPTLRGTLRTRADKTSVDAIPKPDPHFPADTMSVRDLLSWS